MDYPVTELQTLVVMKEKQASPLGHEVGDQLPQPRDKNISVYLVK
jgi:hypothetical protein